jgi:hypothetical protein
MIEVRGRQFIRIFVAVARNPLSITLEFICDLCSSSEFGGRSYQPPGGRQSARSNLQLNERRSVCGPRHLPTS